MNNLRWLTREQCAARSLVQIKQVRGLLLVNCVIDPFLKHEKSYFESSSVDKRNCWVMH